MIKSQDELNPCNDGERSVDVLIHTIEKCEKLEQNLNNVIGILLRVSPEHENYLRLNFPNYFKELEK
jgi:hypothetical protein